jgi:hypothetical protein
MEVNQNHSNTKPHPKSKVGRNPNGFFSPNLPATLRFLLVVCGMLIRHDRALLAIIIRTLKMKE